MMNGSSFEGDSEIYSPQTLVLVGRKGNGKSATGNSILGRKIFRSERSSSGVTANCELKSTTLKDGLMINVIDTPAVDINHGIVGSFVHTVFTEEIMNTVEDGIHAFLVVMSIRSRFSQEEEAAISKLQLFFGSKFYDYMILVFTGGDQLDKDDETLEGFLHDCPQKLKEILNLCENRCVLFDNKTEDQAKRSDQVEKLFSYVNMLSRKNGGKFYNKEMFDEWKALKEPNRSTEPEISMLTGHLLEGQIHQMFEKKLMERTSSLEQQWAAERAARLKAEEDADATQKKADEEICYIKEQIEIARRMKKGPWKPPVIRNDDLCAIL